MKRILRYFFFLVLFCVMSENVLAQVPKIKELHKVKRKETIFGIARDNGLTLEELIEANPEMNVPGYELKKGDYVKIPFPTATQQNKVVTSSVPQPSFPAKPQRVVTDVRTRAIRLGIMLPLHEINGDGKRMVEYYRGVLMACDSLRANGISTDVCAWNVSEDCDIQQVLRDPKAADRDLIIGPLYTKQVQALGSFAKQHNIRLLIPFSISSTEIYDNPNIYQVYQSGITLNQAWVYRFCQRFKDAHVILVDCNDNASTKGNFTSTLRNRLEQEGRLYSLTNVEAHESVLLNCFSKTQRNVVVLNTSSPTALNIAFARLTGLSLRNPSIQITMFGYPEWLQYTRQHLDNLYKFDTYIPSTYYMSPLSSGVEHFKKKYRWNFHQDMQNYPQLFAATGFDQAYYLLKGLHLYGNNFSGGSGMVGYTPLQTPLRFERIGNGGLQNKAFFFVHYTMDHRIETINF